MEITKKDFDTLNRSLLKLIKVVQDMHIKFEKKFNLIVEILDKAPKKLQSPGPLPEYLPEYRWEQWPKEMTLPDVRKELIKSGKKIY